MSVEGGVIGSVMRAAISVLRRSAVYGWLCKKKRRRGGG